MTAWDDELFVRISQYAKDFPFGDEELKDEDCRNDPCEHPFCPEHSDFDSTDSKT